MRRSRYLHVAACFAIALHADDALAIGIRSPFPVSSRARLDLQLVADEATAPWEWDAQSRSALDQSRFMIDLTAGDDRWGTLYAKGAATWQDAHTASGRVAFAIEQGDYLYRFDNGEVRAFGDERRYFTYDLGNPLVDDDVVDDYQHRVGVRADGGSERAGGSLLVSSIDRGADSNLLTYAKARAAWRSILGSVSYQLQEGDATRDHAIVKGEAVAFWKRASAIVSIEQAGYGSGVFAPSWDLEAGSQFVELRLARGAVGDDVLLSGAYRYRHVGDYYQNDFAAYVPRSHIQRAGVYLSHRHSALDGRLLAFFAEGPYLNDVRGLTASARAFWKDNSETNLRAALVDPTDDFGYEAQDAFGVVHASYRRSLQRFMGGIDVLVDDIGIDAATRIGAETRINWNASSALYLRWIVAGDVERSDAVYARLEFRPTFRTWVTLAYGRPEVGDGPYFLEDRDPLPTSQTDDVITITVRGDF